MGFSAEEGKAGQNKEKWVSNYVPYGDYPDGSKAITGNSVSSEQTAVTVESEVQPHVNGDAKWKKNYVPYEGQEDSNKIEEEEKKWIWIIWIIVS